MFKSAPLGRAPLQEGARNEHLVDQPAAAWTAERDARPRARARVLSRDLRRRGVVLLLLLLMCLLGAPARSDDPKPLTNDQIVTMVKAGLSADLVIAKVRQAPKVDFKLEVEDLVALKQQKVPEDVIKAMLDRTSAPAASSSLGASSAGPHEAMNSFESQLEFQREELGMEILRVALSAEQGVQRIRIIRGELSRIAMGTMAFMDYPGLKARARTHERRPALLIKSGTPLTGGRYFLVRLDPDDDDQVRSLKISSYKGRLKSLFGNSRTFMEPDHDWTFEFTAEDLGDDLWKVVPKVDLEPGEYGWYADFGSGAQENGIFDFAVD